MRADKWLWAVRIFRTRTLAGHACRCNLVKLEGEPIKPSRVLKPGDVLKIEKEIAVRECQVLGFPPSRVSAKDVEQFRENLTPEKGPKGKLDFLDFPVAKRDRGQGRPTKRERRQLDRFVGEDKNSGPQ